MTTIGASQPGTESAAPWAGAGAYALEESVFFQALDHPPGSARERFLEQACGGDADLRRAVDGLLSGLERPHSVLGLIENCRAGAASAVTTPQPGDRVGSYLLLERLGEGGMGVVWRAMQREPVVRQVALKIMKPTLSGRSSIGRFDSERQAMAVMNHPNIARIYEGGATPTGEPFFAMEFVDGIPITDYCRQAEVGAAERIRLVSAVCRAVHHAHQRGVIHRDLKPSNVLVCNEGGKAVPKVIDFGVAKVLAHARSAARDRGA
jgi:serine/threonine protein kinase